MVHWIFNSQCARLQTNHRPRTLHLRPIRNRHSRNDLSGKTPENSNIMIQSNSIRHFTKKITSRPNIQSAPHSTISAGFLVCLGLHRKSRQPRSFEKSSRRSTAANQSVKIKTTKFQGVIMGNTTHNAGRPIQDRSDSANHRERFWHGSATPQAQRLTLHRPIHRPLSTKTTTFLVVANGPESVWGF